MPLICGSGPAVFDFTFSVSGRSTALDSLRHAYLDARGEFGFRDHVVGVYDGAVVATGAAWSGASMLAFRLAGAQQILRRFGPFAGVGVVARGLRVRADT